MEVKWPPGGVSKSCVSWQDQRSTQHSFTRTYAFVLTLRRRMIVTSQSSCVATQFTVCFIVARNRRRIILQIRSTVRVSPTVCMLCTMYMCTSTYGVWYFPDHWLLTLRHEYVLLLYQIRSYYCTVQYLFSVKLWAIYYFKIDAIAIEFARKNISKYSPWLFVERTKKGFRCTLLLSSFKVGHHSKRRRGHFQAASRQHRKNSHFLQPLISYVAFVHNKYW